MSTFDSNASTSKVAPPGGVSFAHLAKGVDLLQVAESHELWRVYHENYCIALVHGGAGQWRYRGSYHTIQPNTLMLSEPGEVHTTTAVASPGSFSSLFVSKEFLETQFSSELKGPMHFRLAQVTATVRWRDLGSRLKQLTHRYSGTELKDRLLDELLLAMGELFTHAIEDRFKPVVASEPRMYRARDAIVDNYKADPGARLNVADLAKDLGLSRFQLARLFTKQFGCAPTELHTLLRVARVKRLLAGGGKSLRSVASEAGYADQSHMNREFRAHWGTTPGKFQEIVDSAL